MKLTERSTTPLVSRHFTPSHAKIREGLPPALTILVGVGSVVVVGSAVLVVSVVVMVFPKEQVVGSVVVVVGSVVVVGPAAVVVGSVVEVVAGVAPSCSTR